MTFSQGLQYVFPPSKHCGWLVFRFPYPYFNFFNWNFDCNAL